MARIKQRGWQILIVVTVIATYVAGLGTLPLLGPDEPRYAAVASEMFKRNDWITPTLGGFHWFEKPALCYWLQIVSYHLFGVNEFAARFGSASFGLLTILTIYWLCRFTEKTKNEGQAAKNDLASWAFVISASCLGLIVFSRAATFDIILTFPVTAALACFFVFGNPKSTIHNPQWLVGFYFFIGLALLAKGLVGAVLPFGIIFWYFIAIRRLPSKTFLWSLLWGGFVTAATAAIWYLPMYERHGSEFVNEFFVQHHFARYASNKYAHPEPFWFFWVILPALTLPWLPAFFVALWKAKNWNWRAPETALDKLRIFAVCWTVVPIIFFSFSGSKLPGYILPALPGALILAAEPVRRFADSQKKRAQGVRIIAVIILLAVFIAAETLPQTNFVRSDTSKYLVGKAAENGFAGEMVLNLHDISHSLEFYAAGRLARRSDGRQIKFEGVGEIYNYLKQTDQPQALVIVPLEHEHQLYETDQLTARKIADNNEFALVVVIQQ